MMISDVTSSRLPAPAEVPECVIAPPVERVEQVADRRHDQREHRRQQQKQNPPPALLQKSERRHQPEADVPKQPAQRLYAALQPRLLEEILEPIARVAEEVVGVLVDLPILHGGQDELPSGL